MFDLFHIGHLRYLKFARKQGQELLVGVTPDHMCTKLKGKPPVIPEDQRLEIINGLGWIDQVELLPTPMGETTNAVAWIKDWGIDITVIGEDKKENPRWMPLFPALAERGIEVIFFPYTESQSTTKIKSLIQSQGNKMQ